MHQFVYDFQESLDLSSPGILSLFNIASAKRRNLHLGYQVVDKEIVQLDELIKKAVKDCGDSKRIGGDEWLVFTYGEPIHLLEKICLEFADEQEIETGWRCVATKGEIEKQTKESVPATLKRGVRCIYTSLVDKKQLPMIVEEFQNEIWKIPVNCPYLLNSNDIKVEGNDWKAIDEIHEDVYCPICNSLEFEWDEGTDDSSEGSCKQCGAFCIFRFF